MRPSINQYRQWILLSVMQITFAAHATCETLWRNWYTVSKKGIPYSYYSEKAEIVGDKAKIQVNTWTRETKKIKSEALGAVAKNTVNLEPVLYNLRTQTDMGEEKIIDGSVLENGKVFSVKIKTGITTSKPLRAEMIPKLMLSSFFPLWINKNYKRISGVQPIDFQAILEDQVQTEVPVVKGTAYEMREDDFAKSSKTRKLRIEFGHVVQIWWVAKTGEAVKIECKELETSVKKVDRKVAEAFLNP